MTSVVRLVHKKKKGAGQLFFFSLSIVSLLDDVSQCVDMKKHDGAATTTTTTVTILSLAPRQFRGLICVNQSKNLSFFYVMTIR
jgi:hypothetical protein